MTKLPEHHAHMIRLMAEEGRPIDEISFMVRVDEKIVKAILRGENPDTNSSDEPDNPIFQGYKGSKSGQE